MTPGATFSKNISLETDLSSLIIFATVFFSMPKVTSELKKKFFPETGPCNNMKTVHMVAKNVHIMAILLDATCMYYIICVINHY